ncbi:MAG: dihydrofolate reductase family protein [bacterium]|nr:dihydrofolate reductase family protein [bacterium]
MRKLNAFLFISLNGMYKGANEDTSWHGHGEEEGTYSEQQLAKNNILLFGRTTYEMMYDFWPGALAAGLFPEVGEKINKAEKIVFSTTLKNAAWQNTRVMNGDIVKQIAALKKTEGKDLTILGSGSILSLFSEAGLLDELEMMIDPVVLAKGTPLFTGITKDLRLKLMDSRIFKKSGVILLKYKNAGQ